MTAGITALSDDMVTDPRLIQRGVVATGENKEASLRSEQTPCPDHQETLCVCVLHDAARPHIIVLLLMCSEWILNKVFSNVLEK